MKAVIYARYSSDSQREESIEGQLRECKEYAERNGITVLSTYIDRALSAKTDNRPDFQRMIKDSANGLFDIVLVWKLDRFARNRYDSAHYKAILKKNGVKVVSAKEAIAEDSTGILLESLLEGYAEFYSVELSEKIHRGQKENALKGLNNGGGIPLGYVLGSDKRLAVDPMTAPVVLEIFTRYAEGETVRAIVESLNERGLQTKHNKPYSLGSFNAILKNRKYIGEYRYQDVVIPGGVPAIVPQELFDRVQARIERNKRAPAMSKADEAFLLTTKLFCGKCGRLMVGESGTSHTGKKHYYYKCGSAKRKTGCTKKAVKKDWIENLVVERTMQMIFDDTTLNAIASMVLDVQARENTSLPVLKAQLAQTEQGIQNMLNAIQQGIFTVSTKQRLEELEATKEQLTVSILQEELQKPHLSREQILFFLQRFRAVDTTKQEQRQRLIDSFVNAVYVYDDKIILTFNYQDGTETITLDDINGSDLDASAPPKEEASNSSFTRMSLRLCIGWGTPDGVPFPFSLIRNAVFCVLRRFKPVGVTSCTPRAFSCLKTPLKRSEGYSSAFVHLAFARCKGGRPAGGGWMWVNVQKGCGMGLACYAHLCVPSFVPPCLAGNYGASRLRCLRESTHEACETVLDDFHALLCT